MNMYYPYQNPTTAGYNNNYPSYQNNYLQTQQQRVEVIKVNGKNGAEAYTIPPNSSILLLDETAPIIWLKMTDGGGYPTLTPYDIIPHKDKEVAAMSVDINGL